MSVTGTVLALRALKFRRMGRPTYPSTAMTEHGTFWRSWAARYELRADRTQGVTGPEVEPRMFVDRKMVVRPGVWQDVCWQWEPGLSHCTPLP